eukprot:492430-Amphidinium_carterae.1
MWSDTLGWNANDAKILGMTTLDGMPLMPDFGNENSRWVATDMATWDGMPLMPEFGNDNSGR